MESSPTSSNPCPKVKSNLTSGSCLYHDKIEISDHNERFYESSSRKYLSISTKLFITILFTFMGCLLGSYISSTLYYSPLSNYEINVNSNELKDEKRFGWKNKEIRSSDQKDKKLPEYRDVSMEKDYSNRRRRLQSNDLELGEMVASVSSTNPSTNFISLNFTVNNGIELDFIFKSIDDPAKGLSFVLNNDNK